jgi:hypothetical protein
LLVGGRSLRNSLVNRAAGSGRRSGSNESGLRLPLSRTGGPTHAERARFILEERARADAKVPTAQEAVLEIEGRIDRVVRAVYTRASATTHVERMREEIRAGMVGTFGESGKTGGSADVGDQSQEGSSRAVVNEILEQGARAHPTIKLTPV